MTIVAADAKPVQPINASTLSGCVDINSGQRYDLLLTANQGAGNYWISTIGQFRNGSPAGAERGGQPQWAGGGCAAMPAADAQLAAYCCAGRGPTALVPSRTCPLGAGYAVLHYKGAEEKLPSTKPTQPGSVAPWTLEQAARIVAAPGTAPVRWQ